MSLINDALQKARQAPPQNPPPVSPHFKHVEPVPERSEPYLLITGLILVLILAGGGLIWHALQKRGEVDGETVVRARESKPVTEQASTAKPVTTLESATASASGPAQSKPPEGGDPNAVEPDASKQAEPAGHRAAAETSPVPALPKLRAIFYSSGRPSAVLNNKTVFVGGSVSGHKVLAINQDSVVLLGAGQTNVLTINGRDD